ncbi:hypothetical protein OB905_09145 [Halobacteria archaeon AArc-dxtr1]|nr:hypothetical protein [Halobacteria archaeon AArc-dxtr1]
MILFAAFLVGIVIDARTVGGDPVWLKPATFAASIAIFTATLGWIGTHLPVSDRFLRIVSIGVAVAAFVEIVLIGGQAGRGVESHFNDSTTLDLSIYVVMGVTILVMTLLVGWLLVRSWGRSFDVSPAFAWGIRLGILLFVLGALEGLAMVAFETSALDGGATIPVVGWAIAGDFRVVHFLGLHALQVLPLGGYLAGVAGERGLLERPSRAVVRFGVGYALLLLVAFVQAVSPVFP